MTRITRYDALRIRVPGAEVLDSVLEVDEESPHRAEFSKSTAQTGRASGKAERLRAYVRSLRKDELRGLVLDLVDEMPEARDRLLDRMRLANDDVAEMVAAAREEITGRLAKDAWKDDFAYENNPPDYDRVRGRLEELLTAGHADEVVELGDELLRSCGERIEMHDRDGEIGYDVSRCMEVVFQALGSSTLPPAEKLLWEIDAHLRDDYGVLSNVGGTVSEAEQYPAEAWSEVADILAQRLAELPVKVDGKGGGDRFSRDYARQALMR